MNARVRTLVVVAAFVLVISVLMGDVLLGDRILVTYNTYRWQPWRTYATDEQLNGRTYRTDSARTYLPRGVELSRRITSGELPLWNPYVFCGSPHLADPQARVLYPISLLLAVLDPARALGYDIAIHLLIALVGMYLFLRTTGSTTVAGMIGAFGYGMSSFFVMRMGHPTFFASASWIPFFFYGYERARVKERLGTVMLTVFLALGYLAGFPQVFLFGTTALVLYAFVLGVDDHRRGGWRTWLRNLRILGIAAGLSALVVSAQLLPFWELVRNSVGLGLKFNTMKELFLSEPFLLVRSVVPSFFGNPVEGTRWVNLLGITLHPYNPGFLVYCGVGTLLVALGGLVLVRVSVRIRALAVLLILSVGLASSGLVVRLAYTVVPLFRYSQIDRVSVMACFAIAAIAGMAFSYLSHDGRARSRRLVICIVAGLVVAAIAGSIAFGLSGDRLIDRLMAKAGTLQGDSWYRSSSERIIEWKDGTGSEWLAYERRQVMTALVFAVLSGLLVLGLVSRKSTRRGVRALAGVAFLVLLIVDTGLLVRSYYVSQPAGSLAGTEGVALLKNLAGREGRWRVMLTDPEQAVLPPNTNQIFGIHSLQGLATIVPSSFTDLVRSARTAVRREGWGMPTNRMRPGPISDLMCARYLLSDDSEEPILRSPVMRALAAGRARVSKIRRVTLEGRSDLAFVQAAGESAEVGILLPPVERLDFGFGVEPCPGATCDSLAIVVACRSGSNRIEFTKNLSLAGDSDRWYPASLDVSGLGGGYALLSLSVNVHRGPGSQTSESRVAPADGLPVVAWSGLDLIVDDCPVKPIDGGYEVQFAGRGRVVGLDISGRGAEVPLDIDIGGATRLHRLVTLPVWAKSRVLMLRPPGQVPACIAIRSDSSFTVRQARTVHTGSVPSLDYDIIYKGDMLIYENFAALEKGICVDRAVVAPDAASDFDVVRLAALDDLGAALCGDVEIVSYRPEAVVLDVSADRDCILVFQDLAYPGWQALVDGRERRILRTDVGVRALELGAGRHRVVLEFKPLSFRMGLVLTCLGLVLTVLYAKKAKIQQAVE